MNADNRLEPAASLLGGTPASGATRPLRPALLAPYRDLTELRHDFPLVLVERSPAARAMQSLTGIVNAILRQIAPRGSAGERLRRHVLRLEQEIRRRVAAGAGGRLSAVWDEAAAALLAADPERRDSLAAARAALAVDGALVACDAAMPSRVVTHVWHAVQREKLAPVAERVEGLVLALSDRLATASLSKPRSRRITAALEVLAAQPLLKALQAGDEAAVQAALAAVVFDDCAAARAAWRRQRLALADLVAAITLAEAEIADRADPAQAAAGAPSEGSLGADDQALGPDILLCVTDTGAGLRGEVLDILASGLPIKVLVRADDLLGDPVADTALTLAGTRLAVMAGGLEDAFVMQASAASLVRMAERMARGLAYDGPALFSLYAGRASAAADGQPPYLQAAAAMQARVFPSFSYDPSAGPDLVSRWAVGAHNPHPESDWSVHPFVYEADGRRRISVNLAFTLGDLVVADPRYAGDVALLAAPQWTDAMVAVNVRLNDHAATPAGVPYVPVVDADDRLYRAVVGDAVVAAAARCRDAWRCLQELGGIHNSWAERRLAAEKEIWEEERERESEALAAKAATAAAG